MFKEIWKDISLRLILKDKGGKQHYLMGTLEKGCVETEDRDFSIHFVLGFQENPIYTSHLCFS